MKSKAVFRRISAVLAVVLCLNIGVPAYAGEEDQGQMPVGSQQLESDDALNVTVDSESEMESGFLPEESADDSVQETAMETEESQAEQDEIENESEEETSTEESVSSDQDDDKDASDGQTEEKDIILESEAAIATNSLNSDYGIATYSTNRTQSQAIQWVKSQVGKSLDMDGAYGAQCVDLILAYYDYLGVPRSSGNGADYAYNSLPSGWKRIQGAAPQPGDILVYTGGYGHVAIYESDYSTYHQNFNGHSYVERVTYKYNALSNPYWGVIRPDWTSTTQSSITFSGDRCEWDTINAFVYTKATANVKGTFSEAGLTVWDTSGRVVASKTEKVNYNSTYMEIWYNITDDTGVKLTSGQRYTYQMYAVFNGTKYYTSKKTFITNTIVPSAVSGLRASSAGKNKVNLYWNSVSGADGYLVYAIKNGKYAYCGMSKTNRFTDSKALDTAYNFYWVFPYAENSDGKMFPGKCPKYVYSKGIIPAVQNLKAASVRGGVKLTWSKRNDATGYLIYGRRAGGAYEYVGMTAGTTFTDKKASKTKYNYYWVYPYHMKGSKMIPGGVPKYTYGRAL